jgi:hypothetical protein
MYSPDIEWFITHPTIEPGIAVFFRDIIEAIHPLPGGLDAEGIDISNTVKDYMKVFRMLLIVLRQMFLAWREEKEWLVTIIAPEFVFVID